MEAETDPDAAWVRALSGADCGEAEAALREAASERSLFRHIVREHRREGRSSYIEIDAPLELQAIARLIRPQRVVEVGVSSGVSTAYLLNALRRNRRGRLYSVDRPKFPARPSSGGRTSQASWSLPPGRSPGWAIPHRLRDRWDLRIGDKADMIPVLAGELPSLELFVYDVPHDDREAREEFLRLDAIMPAGAVAIVDHGPGGGLCAALRSWARRRRAQPIGRQGLGLYGMRCAGARPEPVD